MSDNSFNLILAFAIIFALAGQTVALFLIYGMVRRLNDKAADLQARVNPLLAQTGETLAKARKTVDEVSLEVRACAAAVAATTTELSRLSLQQAQELSSFLDEATASARYQIGRLERTVSMTTDRIEETTAIVQGGILQPVREVSAVIIGVKRALEVLFKSERKQINQAYQDEEMFI